MPPEDTESTAPSDLTGGYGNQREYVSKVLPAAAARQEQIEEELRSAFSDYIEKREIDVVIFERMPATDLAKAIQKHPCILKSLLAACNLAGRALKRDLKIDNIDTYEPVLSKDQANAVAGYLLSFLPEYLGVHPSTTSPYLSLELGFPTNSLAPSSRALVRSSSRLQDENTTTGIRAESG